MKTYEEIQDLEKKLHRATEQAAFLRHQLASADDAIKLAEKRMEGEIAEYNERAKRDQEVLTMHSANIEKWTKKLDNVVKKQLKKIEKESNIPVIKPKTQKQIEKEVLEAKKRELEEQLRRLKEKPKIAAVIEDRKLASEELREFAADLNGETKQIEWLGENHSDWIQQYSDEEGGHAIWQGNITKGFRIWCETKGYIIGF